MFLIWIKPSKVMKQVIFILLINLTHLKWLLFISELFKYKFSASDLPSFFNVSMELTPDNTLLQPLLPLPSANHPSRHQNTPFLSTIPSSQAMEGLISSFQVAYKGTCAIFFVLLIDLKATRHHADIPGQSPFFLTITSYDLTIVYPGLYCQYSQKDSNKTGGRLGADCPGSPSLPQLQLRAGE